MKRGHALLKIGETFYAASCEWRKKKIKFEFQEKEGWETKVFEDKRITVSLPASEGLLVHLSFPFKERKKIRLVLKNELEAFIPESLEEMSVDFKEMGNGSVLCLSVQKSTVEEVKRKLKPVCMTTNVLCALYAFSYFRVPEEKDYAIAYIEGNTLSFFLFKDSILQAARQSLFAEDALQEKILEYMKDDKIETLYFVGDKIREDVEEIVKRKLRVRIKNPSPADYVEAESFPGWMWAGLGATLLSINPKAHINLLDGERRLQIPAAKILSYSVYAIFFVSFFLFVLMYLDLSLKQSVLKEIGREEIRIYRSIFSGSPPVTEIEKIMTQRVRTNEAKNGLKSKQISPLYILSELSNRIESSIDIKLNEFSFDGSQFIISGVTTSFSNLERIRDSLSSKDSPFRNVTIDSIDLAGNQVKFRIRGTI